MPLSQASARQRCKDNNRWSTPRGQARAITPEHAPNLGARRAMGRSPGTVTTRYCQTSAEAPLLDLRLAAVGPSLSDALGKDEPALALAPSGLGSGSVMTRALGEVRFGVVGRRGHPALGRTLTTDRWLAYGHVVTRFGNTQTNSIEAELARHHLRRRVGLEVPSFLAGLFVLPGSDLLMNAPLQLVEEAATRLDLIMREAPIRLPRVRVSLCWHARFQRDPGTDGHASGCFSWRYRSSTLSDAGPGAAPAAPPCHTRTRAPRAAGAQRERTARVPRSRSPTPATPTFQFAGGRSNRHV